MAPIETFQAKTIDYGEKPAENCPHQLTLFWDVQKALEGILESRYHMLGHFYFENEKAINDQGDVYIIGKTEDEAFTVVSYSKSANDSGELIFDVVAPQEVLQELKEMLKAQA